jgi:hypothetical protein
LPRFGDRSDDLTPAPQLISGFAGVQSLGSGTALTGSPLTSLDGSYSWFGDLSLSRELQARIYVLYSTSKPIAASTL